MSKLSLSIKFFPLITRQKNDLVPIYCRITVNRKKAEFFTNKWIKESKWDKRKERVKGSPEANSDLTNIEKSIRTIHSHLLDSNQDITAKKIKEQLLGKNETKLRLLPYFDRFIEDLIALPQYSNSTVKKYKTVRNHVQRFLESSNNENIGLKYFTLKHVNELQHYLMTKAQLSINTTTKDLKQLKALFNKAIQLGYIEKNPFEGFKFKTEKTYRTFLTRQELNQIEEAKLDSIKLENVRDIFLFAVYTGLRYSDVSTLTNNDIKEDHNGKRWLEVKEVQKTGAPHRIPLLDKANEILQKRRDHVDPQMENGNLLLPVISNQKINKYLKEVAEISKLDKNLTFHVARHTFATTITLSNEVPIEVVSKMLGHSSLKTTQIYAKITNDYLMDQADILNKKL